MYLAMAALGHKQPLTAEILANAGSEQIRVELFNIRVHFFAIALTQERITKKSDLCYQDLHGIFSV